MAAMLYWRGASEGLPCEEVAPMTVSLALPLIMMLVTRWASAP